MVGNVERRGSEPKSVAQTLCGLFAESAPIKNEYQKKTVYKMYTMGAENGLTLFNVSNYLPNFSKVLLACCCLSPIVVYKLM